MSCIFCDGAGLPRVLADRVDRARRLRDGRPQRARSGSASTPRSTSGFAFGFGLERIAMIRYGIDEIKTFFDGDVRFLAQY